MFTIYNELIYRPLFNTMVYIQSVIPHGDLGLTIIVLTVIIRVIFIPLSLKTVRSQQLLKQLNPRIEEIKEKFKNDTTAQSAAILNLYKENKVNPAAGCLPLIIQLPILIALYRVFIQGITSDSLSLLYSFISVPTIINNSFMGLFDITKSNHILTIIAGLLQFAQSKQAMSLQADNSSSNKEILALSRQMLYIFPVMIIVIGWNLPAGLVIYWTTTTVFSIFEQEYIKKENKNGRVK